MYLYCTNVYNHLLLYNSVTLFRKGHDEVLYFYSHIRLVI